ncbi:hypothetical protein JOB18_015273 [Solea senegalensis]|uniref:Uncharacterized protein n=1 Tax=Solea senegalensis TaxID=28829 RepID=A0AAV6SZ23_SOLSE|nr:hypothetical protein JOB18_015273 [Solea senegalensis]
MSKKQTSLESFFAKGKRPSEEPEEEPTTSKKKKAFNRQYQESYLKYGFIAAGDSHIPSPLCIICGDRLANEAMKPLKFKNHSQMGPSHYRETSSGLPLIWRYGQTQADRSGRTSSGTSPYRG